MEDEWRWIVKIFSASMRTWFFWNTSYLICIWSFCYLAIDDCLQFLFTLVFTGLSGIMLFDLLRVWISLIVVRVSLLFAEFYGLLYIFLIVKWRVLDEFDKMPIFQCFAWFFGQKYNYFTGYLKFDAIYWNLKSIDFTGFERSLIRMLSKWLSNKF